MARLEPFVYYGTSEFSRAVLGGLLDDGARPALVVTTAAKPAGRGLHPSPTPVAEYARAASLPLIEVASLRTEEVQAQLKAAATRVAVLAAFGKIVPPDVLGLYPRGIVNVHPSLLPRYRGPAPIQYAIRDGAAETGVSLIVLDNEVDHGPIIAQRSQPVQPQDDAAALGERLARQAAAMLLEALPRYLAGELNASPQQHEQATLTRKVSREDGRADFSKSAQQLDQQRRAFTPWPGLWTAWQGQRLKLIATSVLPSSRSAPGVVVYDSGQLVIGTADGGLVVKCLQLEGGREMAVADFLRGHAKLVGSTLS